MRLFRSSPSGPAVTEMLHHMENGRFVPAYRALKRREKGPLPPPHALWRLGRWLLEKRRFRQARLPLETFLELYPGHQDRPEVMLDCARVLSALRRTGAARELAAEANRLGQDRDRRRQRGAARSETVPT